MDSIPGALAPDAGMLRDELAHRIKKDHASVINFVSFSGVVR